MEFSTYDLCGFSGGLHSIEHKKNILFLKFRNQYKDLNAILYPSAYIDHAHSWELFYVTDNTKLIQYMDKNDNYSPLSN